MSQRREGTNAVKFGERSAPGLEERLRRDHQNVHARRPVDEGRGHGHYMLHYAALSRGRPHDPL
jgi:hypothetical protein